MSQNQHQNALAEHPPQQQPSTEQPVPRQQPEEKHPVEVWEKDAVDTLKQAGDINEANLVPLWVAVAKTKPIKGWAEKQMLTRAEFEAGLRDAKGHVPAHAHLPARQPEQPPKPATNTVMPGITLASAGAARPNGTPNKGGLH